MSSHAVRTLFRSAIMIVLLGCIISAAVYLWHDRMLHAAGPHQQDVLVIVNPGDGHQVLRSALNLNNPEDQVADFDLVPLKSHHRKVRNAMSNSFGFGGTNGTLIFKKFE